VSCLFKDINSYPFQQKLAQMLSRLIKISEEFNVAVYMTNQGILTCILSFMEVKDNNPHSFGSVVIVFFRVATWFLFPQIWHLWPAALWKLCWCITHLVILLFCQFVGCSHSWPRWRSFHIRSEKTSRRACACSCSHYQVDVQERQGRTTGL